MLIYNITLLHFFFFERVEVLNPFFPDAHGPVSKRLAPGPIKLITGTDIMRFKNI